MTAMEHVAGATALEEWTVPPIIILVLVIVLVLLSQGDTARQNGPSGKDRHA
jgi:hypothetical protein